VRPKRLVIESIDDRDLKKAYKRCLNEPIIQGISRCVACDTSMVGKEKGELFHYTSC
jgi:hypothetical protein